MTVLNESTHTGEFLIAELPGLLSRKEAVLSSGNNLEAGAVLGFVGGEYVALNPAAETGAEDAVAILYAAVDASGGDKPCVVIYKDAAVLGTSLVWPVGISGPNKTAAIAALDALGIVIR
jgi:hypothetical protein